MSKIDFNLSSVRAVVMDVDGVLSPSTVPMDSDGVPCRMVNIKDGYALQLAAKRGLPLAIITGADSQAVKARYNALGITDVYLKAAHKLPILEEWAANRGIALDDIVYIGDDIPDLPAMQAVGLPVAPADADADVAQAARYVTRAIGGYGAVREVLEEILKAKGQWLGDAKAFGW